MPTSSFTRKGGQQRVVVTGMGVISPLGLSADETWKNALNGVSGIDNITKFDAANYEVRFAGEVKNFNPDLYIEKKEQKKMDLFIQYAIACAKMAFDQSGLKVDDSKAHRVGAIIGSGMGGLPIIEEQHQKLLERGPSRVSAFFIPSVITNLASGWITMNHNLKGPSYCISSACASGVHSLGEAYNYVRFGLADAMIAGGTESTISPIAIAGFTNMKALSTRNDDPKKASRPWDKDRDGFVLGEGAALFVIESLESALKRGANILCEVTGYSASSDAYHITSPEPNGAGFLLAMNGAIQDAAIAPDQINYINAHGTSTPVGDPIESNAVKTIFKEHAKKVWISSTKSMTGHLLGAAGALETAFSIQAIVNQAVPPTINLENPSPECDLDYVAKTARQGQINHVMNNSFGFGGTNGSMIFTKFNG